MVRTIQRARHRPQRTPAALCRQRSVRTGRQAGRQALQQERPQVNEIPVCGDRQRVVGWYGQYNRIITGSHSVRHVRLQQAPLCTRAANASVCTSRHVGICALHGVHARVQPAATCPPLHTRDVPSHAGWRSRRSSPARKQHCTQKQHGMACTAHLPRGHHVAANHVQAGVLPLDVLHHLDLQQQGRHKGGSSMRGGAWANGQDTGRASARCMRPCCCREAAAPLCCRRQSGVGGHGAGSCTAAAAAAAAV